MKFLIEKRVLEVRIGKKRRLRRGEIVWKACGFLTYYKYCSVREHSFKITEHTQIPHRNPDDGPAMFNPLLWYFEGRDVGYTINRKEFFKNEKNNKNSSTK